MIDWYQVANWIWLVFNLAAGCCAFALLFSGDI